jgi:8-oxo-dGTP diphosphatase
MVGVGVILLDEAADQVLLIRRASAPAAGCWSVPGGLVDPGETLRDAALRELREETGLEATLLDVAAVVERVVRDSADRVQYHYLIVDFVGRVSAGTPCASSDAADARWVPVADVPALEHTGGLVAAIARARCIWLGQPAGSVLVA